MTDISHPLKPKPERPIDPLTLLVIGKIQQAADRLGLEVFVVGAVARIILLENIHGLNAGRATTDVDCAFAVDHWEQFHAIRTLLLENPAFSASEHVAHRLYFRAPGSEHPATIDLIPFGGVETDQYTVAWPPDMAILMSVAGFRDAFAAAVRVEVRPGLEIPVASLPGITLLKLFAWAERRQENPKDALDLLALLRSYHQAGNEHRIYEQPSARAALEATEYDPELAGAWLLGNDVATMASTTTVAALEALLNGATMDRLIEDMSRAMKGREDAMDHAHRLLEQFTKSFTA
ncbi:MAG: nucleotidyl transferase AbiEii/AbiGii toxin family protein [Rhodocyclaceae bacterium]|nr:nucleotidyl transferase AbiEii/AbiGii toxin family protein [Rhodocyclaceae bacterium]